MSQGTKNNELGEREPWFWNGAALVFFAIIVVSLLLKDEGFVGIVSALGTLLGGFASAIAFLWLIHGYRMQAAQLELQRNELEVQGDAIKIQAKELRKASQLASLEQVRLLYQNACDSVCGRNDNLSVKDNLYQLQALIVSDFNEVFSNENVNVVEGASNDLIAVHDRLNGFYTAYRSAVIIYLEHYLDLTVDKQSKDLLEQHKSQLMRAEYLFETFFLMKDFERNIRYFEVNYDVAQIARFTILVMKQNLDSKTALGKIDSILNSQLPTPAITAEYRKQLLSRIH